MNRRWRVLILTALLVTMLVPAGALAQEEEITIHFWNWWGVQREPLMDEIIADFNEEYPDVKIENMVQAWDRRSEQVLTAMAANPLAVPGTRFCHLGEVGEPDPVARREPSAPGGVTP